MFRAKTIICAGAVALWAGPAVASTCEAMWLLRNLVFDRLGHCFSSPLGQAVFDNSDCGGSASPTGADAALVARIRAAERAFGCALDTGQTGLELPRRDLWMRLETLPVRDETESACIGLQTGPVPLRAAASPGSSVLSWAVPGATVLYQHVPVAGWDFVEVTDGQGRLLALGWTDLRITAETCRMVAG